MMRQSVASSLLVAVLVSLTSTATSSFAQSASEPIDLHVLHSQSMETLFYISDVYGPRITIQGKAPGQGSAHRRPKGDPMHIEPEAHRLTDEEIEYREYVADPGRRW
jgi:hypothetical protein